MHRTGADRVGKLRRTRPETGWVYALLYRLQTLERADRKGLLPIASNGRLFGQFRDSEFLHDACLQLRLLADTVCTRRPRKNLPSLAAKDVFNWRRMPFGLCNAPATFQRTIDILLTGYRWRSCLVYLEDVIVFSTTFDGHLRHVEEILRVLKEAGLSLKLRKCNFFAETVDYLAMLSGRAAWKPRLKTQPLLRD